MDGFHFLKPGGTQATRAGLQGPREVVFSLCAGFVCSRPQYDHNVVALLFTHQEEMCRLSASDCGLALLDTRI